MNFEKENFIRTKLVSLLQKLKNDEPARWGKMNVQQMIEHFTDVMMVASGKMPRERVSLPEGVPFFSKPYRQTEIAMAMRSLLAA